MKMHPNQFARAYEAALQKHLESGARVCVADARELGNQAVASGLETLGLVRIHERALTQLVTAAGSSQARTGALRRATAFFAEVILPIEQTHPAALKDKAKVKQMAKTLDQSSAALATANQELKEGISQRQNAEQALQDSGNSNAKLLTESRRLQTHLRELTHKMFTTQEKGRKQASTRLHDEIAQTLLGINVWLLALKATAASNAKDLQKEIASMEQLVKSSSQTLRRFAREFGKHHEA